MINPTTIESIGGAVTALSGIYATVRHFSLSFKIKKEQERKAILDKATEELTKVKTELEDKIKVLEIELQNQKQNMSRDISHMKEIYNTEIKTLANKIDELKKDLADQHSSMVALLTKLVNSR